VLVDKIGKEEGELLIVVMEFKCSSVQTFLHTFAET
jgi:hypothetical protein